MPFVVNQPADFVYDLESPFAVKRTGFFDSGISGDVLSRQLSEIRVGATRYPLRETLRGSLLPNTQTGQIEIQFPAISAVKGTGATPNDAVVDFQRKLHTLIQSGLCIRPFERSNEEQQEWAEIDRWIDIERYFQDTPIHVRQFGVVRDTRPGHWSVRWDNGRHEGVDLELFPDEFAGYKPGQPFEAVVLRDRRTLKLVRAVDVARRSPPKHLTPDQNKELWNSIGTIESAEDVEWK